MVGDSGAVVVGVADLLGGVATLLGGVVEETFSDGTSSGFEVIEGGGALVLRIRSTLMFATIFIISISPVCVSVCVCVCVCVVGAHPPNMFAMSNAVDPLLPLRFTAAPWRPSNLATSYLLQTHTHKATSKGNRAESTVPGIDTVVVATLVLHSHTLTSGAWLA